MKHDWHKNNSIGTKIHDRYYIVLHGLLRDPEFTASIDQLRKKHGIPDEGFKVEYVYSDDGEKLIASQESKVGSDFRNDLNEFVKRFQFPILWTDVFEHLILHNEIKQTWLGQGIMVEDVLNYLSIGDYTESEIAEYDIERVNIEVIEDLVRNQPIGIFIPPFATKNEILDFIEKNYTAEIRPLQEKYKESYKKHAGFRRVNPKVWERKFFIYENREKSAHEIDSLVADKFGSPLGYDYVGKILREMKKIYGE